MRYCHCGMSGSVWCAGANCYAGPDHVECGTCGRELTDTERHYYGNTCETCEGEWLDAIETWRHGGRNDYLDEQFK